MQDFTPENTPTKLYIDTYIEPNFDELMEMAKCHFGAEIDFSTLTITSEYIHTRCINYDLYEPNDYDNYIVIELINYRKQQCLTLHLMT